MGEGGNRPGGFQTVQAGRKSGIGMTKPNHPKPIYQEIQFFVLQLLINLIIVLFMAAEMNRRRI